MATRVEVANSILKIGTRVLLPETVEVKIVKTGKAPLFFAGGFIADSETQHVVEVQVYSATHIILRTFTKGISSITSKKADSMQDALSYLSSTYTW